MERHIQGSHLSIQLRAIGLIWVSRGPGLQKIVDQWENQQQQQIRDGTTHGYTYVAQGLCGSLVAQGRQKEAVDTLQAQQHQIEEGKADSAKVNPVELQLLLGKVRPGALTMLPGAWR